MNNIIKQLKNGAKNTRLSSAEKAEMKSVLLQYVHMHPVDASILSTQSIPSPFYTSRFRNKKTISAMLIGSLLVGSSVSFAAEGSVPGDILFPIKVSVNEGVRWVVAVTPEAKAELEVKLIERRLVEVEKLAEDPNATLKAQEEAAELLKKYTHAANERFETVENDNDGDEDTHIITNLSAVLSNHERILTEIHSDMVKVEEESRKSSDGEGHERIVASSERVVTSANATTTAVTTISVPSEHARNIESVNNVLQHVRDSIKEIEEKTEEFNKKSNSTEDTSTTPVTPRSTKKEEKQNDERKSSRSTSESDVATTTPVVVIPSKMVEDEHQAVIETRRESSVATSTRPTEERKLSETRNEKTKTEDEELHKEEDSHTETSKTATSTSEHD